MPKKLTTEEFIKKSKTIHCNKYDYSLVKYEGIYKKVKIICHIHGIFDQIAKSHLKGYECKKCGHLKTNMKHTLNNEQFIEKARIIHGDRYDYSLVKYMSAKIKVKIICPIHGVFEQTPTNHTHKTNPAGCSVCKSSKGERVISQLLQSYNINYISQKYFEDLKRVRVLYFDFYLPDLNICIEYDGIQHFKPIECFGGENKFKLDQLRDKIKNDYCNENNIKLLRIK